MSRVTSVVGMIPLSQIRQVRYLPNIKSGCAFDIQTPDRTYHFHAQSKQEALNWISAINTARDGGNIQRNQSSIYQGHFSVGILRARGLPEKNPYCELDVQTETGKSLIVKSTQVVSNSSDPQWQAWFELSTEPALKAVNWHSLVLVFRVMQAGAMKSRMGTFRVNMSEIPEGNQKDLWGQLKNSKQDKLLQGHLSVAVTYQTANFIRRSQRFVFGRSLDLLPCTRVYGYEAPIPTILLILGDALRRHGAQGEPEKYDKDINEDESSMMHTTTTSSSSSSTGRRSTSSMTGGGNSSSNEDQENIRKRYGGLATVGIFRIAPKQDEAEELKAVFNSGKYDSERGDVHCLSHLIKTWFRELPTPLFSDPAGCAVENPTANVFSLLNRFLEINSEDETSDFIQRHLTAKQRSILEWLLDLGISVAQLEPFNKMSAHAFAIVMGPNLINIPDGGPNQPPGLLQQGPVRTSTQSSRNGGLRITSPNGGDSTEELANLVMRQAVNFLELAMKHRARTFRPPERHGHPLDEPVPEELQLLYNQLQRCRKLGMLPEEKYREIKISLLQSAVEQEAREVDRLAAAAVTGRGSRLAGSRSFSSSSSLHTAPSRTGSFMEDSRGGGNRSRSPSSAAVAPSTAMPSAASTQHPLPEEGEGLATDPAQQQQPTEGADGAEDDEGTDDFPTGMDDGDGDGHPQQETWKTGFDWEGQRFWYDIASRTVRLDPPEDGRPVEDPLAGYRKFPLLELLARQGATAGHGSQQGGSHSGRGPHRVSFSLSARSTGSWGGVDSTASTGGGSVSGVPTAVSALSTAAAGDHPGAPSSPSQQSASPGEDGQHLQISPNSSNFRVSPRRLRYPGSVDYGRSALLPPPSSTAGNHPSSSSSSSSAKTASSGNPSNSADFSSSGSSSGGGKSGQYPSATFTPQAVAQFKARLAAQELQQEDLKVPQAALPQSPVPQAQKPRE